MKPEDFMKLVAEYFPPEPFGFNSVFLSKLEALCIRYSQLVKPRGK